MDLRRPVTGQAVKSMANGHRAFRIEPIGTGASWPRFATTDGLDGRPSSPHGPGFTSRIRDFPGKVATYGHRGSKLQAHAARGGFSAFPIRTDEQKSALEPGENRRTKHDNGWTSRGALRPEAKSVTEGAGELTDEALMLRYQRGDGGAFGTLVRRHERPLYNFVLRRLRSTIAAEDVTQETFVRVVQNATTFKHEARFSTWLYSIARNLCVDQSRRDKLRDHPSLDATTSSTDSRTLGERVADPSRSGDVDRSATVNEVQHSILKALDGLPDEQREVFLLREVANLPFKEIAVVVGTNENTVKSRMRYALERLREALSEFEEYARALR